MPASPLRSVLRPLTLVVTLAGALAAADSIALRSPLVTELAFDGPLPEAPVAVAVDLEVPSDAPADLGCGIYLADDDGLWWQIAHPETLGPGRHRLRIAVDALHIRGEPHSGIWNHWEAERIRTGGLFLWSARPSTARVVVHALRPILAGSGRARAGGRLTDFATAGLHTVDGVAQTRTGEVVEWRVRPDPFPKQPFAAEVFALHAEVVGPDGRLRIPGFYRQDMDLRDRGDREEAVPVGGGRFVVRWRPRTPGRHRIELIASWANGRVVRAPLPEILVAGPPRDPFVRIDRDDPRFFATGDGDFLWPIGINARSVNDPRGAERTGSRLTPPRGFHAYEAYLERWAANGVTAAEVWMSSWNLALEWRADWPGFDGAGAYHQGNAERLDRLLERAWELGIRINLVIRNHGMASTKTDAEWQHNPWNRAVLGGDPGPVAQAADFFTDPEAIAGQDRLRRYVIARWADHPSILGWKLWSEINLTAGDRHALRSWHRMAARRWKDLDPYQHPVTTHWSGNYRTPDRAIVGMSEIDYVSIDAYHGRESERRGILFADLAWDGLHESGRGLGVFAKPILITEYGGNWNAAPEPQLIAEHRHGPWAALVSGYAGSPMLWWMEWVDQGARFAPYRAIGAFVAGEDLRSTPQRPAQAVVLPARAGDRALWCRAWTRRGRLLGYLLDPEWGYDGLSVQEWRGAEITVAESVRPGPMRVEWWDADSGQRRASRDIQHPGGRLALAPPPFRRHLAFKLVRLPESEPAPGDGDRIEERPASEP